MDTADEDYTLTGRGEHDLASLGAAGRPRHTLLRRTGALERLAFPWVICHPRLCYLPPWCSRCNWPK